MQNHIAYSQTSSTNIKNNTQARRNYLLSISDVAQAVRY